MNEKPEENLSAQPEIADETPVDNVPAAMETADEKPVEDAPVPPEITDETPVEDAPAAPEITDEKPEESVFVPPAVLDEPLAETEKTSSSGRIKKIAIPVCAAVLLIAAAAFLLSFFSANARFNRALEKNDYEAAEEIVGSGKLTASEKNDAHFLTLADWYLKNFNSKKDDYETAMRKIIDLKSAAVYDEATRKEIETREKSVVESHLGKIYNAYSKQSLSYDDAVKQISESNPFDEDLVKSLVDQYREKTDEKREELYADVIQTINDDMDDYTPEELMEMLASFGDFRSAQALTGIFSEIKEDNGIKAARLLLDYQTAIEDSEDVIDAEAPSAGLFEEIKDYILDACFETSNSMEYNEKLQKRIGFNYTNLLLGDSSRKISSLCGNESIRAMNLGKELDLGWFSGCKGGTGKILYIARYESDTSSSTRDEYYYYYYEDIKDVPLEKMPESLEDVEYLIVYDEGGKFYSDYYSNDGQKVDVYRRTAQVTVRQYPSGDVIYDSGVLTGPTPKSSFQVSTGTKFAYGEDPDLSAATAKVKEAVGLK